jgi:S-adenosylmethionine:tRNA-ribosyltransferase-isomerase (queuine synthetase)
VAIGTTVVRALEDAARVDGLVRAGEGLATERLGSTSVLRVVDAILSGTHEPGTSHYELLRAFVRYKHVDYYDAPRFDRAYDWMKERGLTEGQSEHGRLVVG